MFEMGFPKDDEILSSSTCPIAWMDDLYEITIEVDKVFTF